MKRQYLILQRNSAMNLQDELTWYNSHYKRFLVHGGVCDYDGLLSVLVSYIAN